MKCVYQQYSTYTPDRREHRVSKRAFVEREMASILPERKSAEDYCRFYICLLICIILSGLSYDKDINFMPVLHSMFVILRAAGVIKGVTCFCRSVCLGINFKYYENFS